MLVTIELFQKPRYATEDDMPPPPSPPQIRETVALDGISRQGSLERGLQRKVSLDRDQILRDTSKQVCSIYCFLNKC